MKNHWVRIFAGLLVLAAAGLAACASSLKTTPTLEASPAPAASALPAAVKTATQEAFVDPFAYCASVGAVDKPDGRYSGPKITDAILKSYLKAAGLDVSSPYSDNFRTMTIWRCMDKKVYACNFGANLPCDSKANTDKAPTQGMMDYCKANLNSDFIPMYVTGHETIYSFHCVKDKPEVLDQINQVDAAGFLSNIWYALTPTP